jgi:hypothetical protein
MERFLKMNILHCYVSRTQRERYKEALAKLSNRWDGSLRRILTYVLECESKCKGKELRFEERDKEWAEEVWQGGFHKDEYVELYAGIRSKFRDCSADCALLCIPEEQLGVLYPKLKGELRGELEYEHINGNKVLLKKLTRDWRA